MTNFDDFDTQVQAEEFYMFDPDANQPDVSDEDADAFMRYEGEEFDRGWDEAKEDGFTDAEADADALASAGWGTDEDYGCFDDYSSEW